MEASKRNSVQAMAFYHQDGFPAAWQQAMKFAGKGGRLATMPDIIAARLVTEPGEIPWERYFTTLTAEYLGFSKAGNRILIVAHGIGPMSTLEGIEKAYSWEYKDKQRNRRGGRITAREFLDLERGEFGEVEIIDFESYCRRYEYPFLETLRLSKAIVDPVLKARFGPHTERYLQAHAEAARIWHRKQATHNPENKYNLPDHEMFLLRRRAKHINNRRENSDPFIIKLECAANCCYTFGPGIGHRHIEDGYAIGHLLSTSALCHLHHQGYESLTLDVSCHEWWNGVRLVGIKSGGSIQSGLHQGPDAYKLLRKHWRELLMPANNDREVGFCSLIRIGDQWLTQYPKIGERMDTGEPEYVVTSAKKIGEPVPFHTTSNGSPFFKFGINEIKAIAPSRANAYSFLGEATAVSNVYSVCMVQFYRIEADTSKRLINASQLARDYDTMMRLLAKEAA